MSIPDKVFNLIGRLMAEGGPTEQTLSQITDLLVQYRCLQISHTLAMKEGLHVLGGPFAGMALVSEARDLHAPVLLGCYEKELHGVLRDLAAASYDRVINIGCGEGYYAVGIKRMLPSVEMWAYDTDPAAQDVCRAAAALNAVDIHVGGAFDPADFARHARYRTLIWCDIEGAEQVLLDPDRWPALADMDILVETHPTDLGHTIDHVPPRFARTHRVHLHRAGGQLTAVPAWLRDGAEINLLLAQFEGRGVATPWAMMHSHALHGPPPSPVQPRSSHN